MSDLSFQRDFLLTQLGVAAEALGTPSLLHTLTELESSSLKDELEHTVAHVDFFRTKHWDSIDRLGLYRIMQYALVRVLNIQNAVETGVLHGLTSAFILQAMWKSNSGTLVSIDLPSTFENGPANQDGFLDTLPPAQPSGWAIPSKLRSFWRLEIGSSQALLPSIAESGTLDYFIHDSEHTYSTMMFEFKTAWSALKPGGLLVADNIDCNTSFFDFCRQVKCFPYVAPVDPMNQKAAASGIRFGAIRK